MLLMSLNLGFAETGKASWYSRESVLAEGSSGITASGEKLDDKKLTCARRARNFGSRFRVTNLSNNKSIVVKANDFGPAPKYFRKDRVIDLSKAAFSQIANLKTGIIAVKVEAL